MTVDEVCEVVVTIVIWYIMQKEISEAIKVGELKN